MARRVHAVRPREGLDRLALIGAFVIGATGTILLKVYAAPILMTAAYPVGILSLYVAVSLLSRAVTLEPETVGDNAYYLGFLFTLSSLAVTLFQIRNLTGGEGDFIPQVISGFGIALSSTIWGVFLRILLMQMRPDITARDNAARRELAQGAREFRGAIAEATRGLKAISLESAQHTAERNRRMDLITESFAVHVQAMTDAHAGRLQDALEAHSARLSLDMAHAVRSELRTVLAPLHQAATEAAQALKTLAEAQKGQAAALAQSEAAFTAASHRMAQALEDHQRRATEGLDRLSSRGAAVSAQLSAILDVSPAAALSEDWARAMAGKGT